MPKSVEQSFICLQMARLCPNKTPYSLKWADDQTATMPQTQLSSVLKILNLDNFEEVWHDMSVNLSVNICKHM